MARPLHVVLLGRGKTGSVIAEVAAERGHRVTALTEVENLDGAWLTVENLRGVDAVIDFTDAGRRAGEYRRMYRDQDADGGGHDWLVRRVGPGEAGS